MFRKIQFIITAVIAGLVFFSEKEPSISYAFDSTIYSDQTDSSFVNNLLKASEPFLELGDFEKALAKIDSGLVLSQSIGFDNGIILSNTLKADIFVSQKQPDAALEVIDNTLNNYSESIHHVRLHSLKGTALNMKGLSEEALESFEKALSLIPSIDREKQDRTQAATLVNMATVYQRLGNKPKTLENYLLGLEFAEASKDTSFLLIVLNNLGDSFNTYEEYDKSKFYLERALNIANIKDFKADLLRIQLNLANVYTNLGDTDLALDYYQRALVLNKEVRPDTPPFQIIYNLGQLYLNTGEYEKAESSFQESLQYCLDLNIPIGLYFNYMGLGNVNEATSNNEEAIVWYDKSLEIAKSLGQLPFISSLNDRLYKLHKALGNHEEALIALEDYKAAFDSLTALDSENMISELESRIELNRQTEINTILEEKQLEQEKLLESQFWLNIAAAIIITTLLLFFFFVLKSGRDRKKINQVLEVKKKELEEMNAVKDKLFAIVAHDLRSPMTSMQGMLYLLGNSEDQEINVKELTSSLEPVLQRNIDTLDDLLIWARLQMSGINLNPKLIDTKYIVDDLISKQSFQSDAKKIKVVNNIPDPTLAYIDADGFKLIIRNLLSNSIKFTDVDGQITFDCVEQGNEVIISVKDTGIGIPSELQEGLLSHNTKSRDGTDNERGTGFGLSISREFIQKMNGSLYFESKENIGTTFYIKLPKRS